MLGYNRISLMRVHSQNLSDDKDIILLQISMYNRKANAVLSDFRGISGELKEIGTIKRVYSVYGVYYVLLHFIQSSVITKCGFIPEKRS